MTLIVLQLPEPKNAPEGRPERCPYCRCQVLQRWGRVSKPVTGRLEFTAVIYRYKCNDCQKTFRYYPKGIDRSGMTNSIRNLAVLLSAMGLSSRKIKDLFDRYGIHLSHMTIWREGQELAQSLDGNKITILPGKLPQQHQNKDPKEKDSEVAIAIRLREDSTLILGLVNEQNPSRVIQWLQPQLREFNIKAFQVGPG